MTAQNIGKSASSGNGKTPFIVRPTPYNGILFRSRTEARWAVFLDKLDVSWEYEHESYELPTGTYLPDFYLRDWDLFLEIKGKSPTRLERLRCQQLATATLHGVILAVGAPSKGPLTLYTAPRDDDCGLSLLCSFARCRKCPALVITTETLHQDGFGSAPLGECQGDVLSCGEKYTPLFSGLEDAVSAALDHRFGVYPK